MNVLTKKEYEIPKIWVNLKKNRVNARGIEYLLRVIGKWEPTQNLCDMCVYDPGIIKKNSKQLRTEKLQSFKVNKKTIDNNFFSHHIVFCFPNAKVGGV